MVDICEGHMKYLIHIGRRRTVECKEMKFYRLSNLSGYIWLYATNIPGESKSSP